jgi:membrane associated rhomboid family serine protease
MKTVCFEGRLPTLTWVYRFLWIYVGIFVLREVWAVWFRSDWLDAMFCLPSSMEALWQPWRFLTYSFLHEGALHLLFNGWMFYALAQFLLRYELRVKTFFGLYALGIFGGGLVWFGVHGWRDACQLLGASAGVLTLMTYFCCLYPEKVLSLLLLVFPIQIQARWCLVLVLAWEGLHALFYELHGLSSIAHSAHLGGMAVGWLAFRWQQWREQVGTRDAQSTQKPVYRVYRSQGAAVDAGRSSAAVKNAISEGK